MNINVLVDQMLENTKIEKEIANICNSSNEDYFYDNYDGNISEHILFDYCLHAKHNRCAREILKQILRYCNAESLSARVLLEIANLPRKESETCYHYLAHCPLTFLQKYSIFLKSLSSELLIDLLDCMCTQKQFVDDDIYYLLTYVTSENLGTIRYFIGTFDKTTDTNVKRKLAIINSWITENFENS